MKHAEEFNEFLRKEVNLDATRLGLLHRRVRLVAEFISRELDSFEKRENQGSYALGTVIQPTEGRDYDSDVLIYMEDDHKKGPADYLHELYACLVKHPDYSGKLRQRTKSIETNYGDGFHTVSTWMLCRALPVETGTVCATPRRAYLSLRMVPATGSGSRGRRM